MIDRPRAQGIYRAAAIASGLALPWTALALLMWLNPFALWSSAGFTIENRTPQILHVTPLGAVRMASGEARLSVLPQLALPFLAAPALRHTDIAVPAGGGVTIRGNFDDMSLGFLAVRAALGEEKAMVVDRNAARGGCCYPPRDRTIAIVGDALIPAERAIVEAVAQARAHERSRLMWWYGFTGGGLLAGAGFVFSLRRYRKSRPGA